MPRSGVAESKPAACGRRRKHIESVQQANGIVIDHQPIVRRAAQESLTFDVGEELHHRFPEPGHLQQRHRLLVHTKLRPRPRLEKLLKGAESTGQHDERVGEFREHRLAFMHRIDDVQGGQTAMCHFALHERVWHDADHLTAGGQRPIGQCAHAPRVSATKDHRLTACREEASEAVRRDHIIRHDALVGGAVHANSLHAHTHLLGGRSFALKNDGHTLGILRKHSGRPANAAAFVEQVGQRVFVLSDTSCQPQDDCLIFLHPAKVAYGPSLTLPSLRTFTPPPMSDDQASAFPTLTVLDHPLVRHKLTLLRDRATPTKQFKELVDELAMLMAYEATRDLALDRVPVDTPLESTMGWEVRGKKLTLVPILRAGLGMVEGILRLMPSARVGHIGLYRDHTTLEPVDYYFKVPGDASERDFLLLDPMLATGGSASAAVGSLKRAGATRIRFLCLVAAPEGMARFAREHPDVPVLAACLDRELNELGYILPGLGDAGDRLFGTR